MNNRFKTRPKIFSLPVLYFITFSILFSYILILNQYYPYMADDYSKISYLKVFKIDQFNSVLKMSKQTYLTWNPRIGDYFFSYLSVWLGDEIFNILNTIITISLAVILFVIANGKRPNIYSFRDYFSLLFIFFAYTMFCTKTKETLFWLSGATNYLWGAWLLFIFLIPYRYLMTEKNFIKNTTLSSSIIFLIGFMAGQTNENSVPIIFILIIILFFYLVKTKKNIPGWYYFGFTGFFLGMIIFFSSPGLHARMKFSDSNWYFNNSIWLKLFTLPRVFHLYWKEYSILNIVFVILLVSFMVRKFTKSKNPEPSLILFGFISYSMAALLFAVKWIAVRALFIPGLFLVIALASYIFSYHKTRHVKIITGGFLLLGIIYSVSVFKSFYLFNEEFKNREKIILDHISKGVLAVELPAYKSPSRKIFIEDITDDPLHKKNRVFAQFYNLKEVIRK